MNVPDYADEENKKLYEEIQMLKKQTWNLEEEIIDRTERKALMKSHYENIVLEIQNSQLFQNQKTLQIKQLTSKVKISLKEQEKILKERELIKQEIK